MIKKLYILGNHIQALGLARQANKIGLKVHLYNKDKASIARFSIACDHFQVFKSQEHLLQLLTSDLSSEKDTLLIATNDSLIDFLSKNYSVLNKYFYLSIPVPSVVDICYNKRHTYRKAIEIGIPVPLSYFPDSRAELDVLKSQIKYPVVIKPAVMHTFHKKTGKKVFFCRTQEELVYYYDKVIQIIPNDEVIVQEFLDGGAKSLYSFGSFFGNGMVYGSFSANRIRQNPMDFGNSTTYAITVNVPEFEIMAEKFLKSIDYFGLSEVEFMQDLTTGEYKLLEINPRAWKWHSISNKLNINLLGMMVDFLEGKQITVLKNSKNDVAWIERITDTSIVLKELLKGRMKLSDYLKSLQRKKEKAVWSWSDPLPSLMYLILSPYLFIIRK